MTDEPKSDQPHVMAHQDIPTWCVACGTFDHNCRPGDVCRPVSDERAFWRSVKAAD